MTTITPTVPKMIGICGYPTHGKSTVQRFLSYLGVQARDDADSLRRGACKRFNLTWDQVSTQSGKLEIVEAYGTRMTVRQVLGDYGQEFETEFGPNYWIDLAIRELVAEGGQEPVSWGSLRRTQPRAVRAKGGFILAIMDPRKGSSGHEFDEYDFEAVDCMVMNDGSIADLCTRTLIAVSEYITPTRSQIARALAVSELGVPAC